MLNNSLVSNPWKTAAASAALLLAATHASAADITYNFSRITNNSATDVASQLSITLWDADGANSAFGENTVANGAILFTVKNAVGIRSSVSEVYFDDGDGNGRLAGPSTVINNLGGTTKFTGGSASPSNLPGGNLASPAFIATQTFSVDSTPGNPDNGVNASADILGIVLGVGSLVDFNGVAAAVADGSLRFGLHVRDLGVNAKGESISDSFVNEVPLPAAAWLFGSALLGFAGITRRRTKAATS
jgi:hypothetical protein